MDEFYANLWHKRLPRLEALRQAQLTVLRQPERVEQRARELAAELKKQGVSAEVLAARGIGDEVVAVRPAPGRRSPVAWWAAFVLSGETGR
jgi:CHAT domain-containing protein